MRTIAIVGGGNSSEAEISIKSAFNLKEMFGTDLYTIHVIFIRNDTWVVKDENGDIPINKADFSFEKNGDIIHFDCIYLTIHGTPGENGILQSYFDLLNIPYTSCDVFTSALTFNKFATKTFLKEYGVLSAKAVLVRANEKINENEIIEETGLPCFVKPNNGGSSFGVTKVTAKEQLIPAVDKALKEDDEIIIESFIDGIELTNGAYRIKNETTVLPITEITTENDFFDYEAKYQNKSEEITPARLPEELTKECQSLTKKIYSYLNCKGVVRVDYILSDGLFYMLEINTVPGLSRESIIPQQIRAVGMTERDVFSAIIENSINNKNR